MMSEHKITGTRNIILLDAFNAINDIINRIIKTLITLAAFIVLAIHAYGVMAADWIIDVITMVFIPRLECGLAA